MLADSQSIDRALTLSLSLHYSPSTGRTPDNGTRRRASDELYQQLHRLWHPAAALRLPVVSALVCSHKSLPLSTEPTDRAPLHVYRVHALHRQGCSTFPFSGVFLGVLLCCWVCVCLSTRVTVPRALGVRQPYRVGLVVSPRATTHFPTAPCEGQYQSYCQNICSPAALHASR